MRRVVGVVGVRTKALISEVAPDVGVRRVDELGKSCGIDLVTGPQLHVRWSTLGGLELADTPETHCPTSAARRTSPQPRRRRPLRRRRQRPARAHGTRSTPAT